MNTQSFDCTNVTVGGGHFQSDYGFSSSNIQVGGGHDQYDYNTYVQNRTETAYNRFNSNNGTTPLGVSRSSILGQIKTVGNDSESKAWTYYSESESLKHSFEASKEMMLALGEGLAGNHNGALEHGLNAFIEQGKSFSALIQDTYDIVSGLWGNQGTITGIPDRDK